MNKYRILLVFLLLLIISLGMADELPAAENDQIMISLDRGMCFGTCPVYTVTLYENGTVHWNGEMYVDVVGEASAEIDPDEVRNLSAYIEERGFFTFNDTYVSYDITDLPWATLMVNNGTHVKQVEHYHGDNSAPAVLHNLEDAVDVVANTSVWIGEGGEEDMNGEWL